LAHSVALGDLYTKCGEFTVNIALIENRQPIFDIAYVPILNVCYYTAIGVGAYVKRSAETA